MRVLYLVHAHQSFSVGGTENAAFALFNNLISHQGIEPWILCAIQDSRGILQPGELQSVEGTDREYLIGTDYIFSQLMNANIFSLGHGLKSLLDHVKPDVIHLQHYIHFGIDVIPLLQTLCPTAKIVVTLHEYLALCMHNGQMVTTQNLKLCHKATPLACSMCFPDKSTKDMFLRHHYIKTILESCNALISPSNFLIARYLSSGICHQNFHMIENGLPLSVDEMQRAEHRKTYSSKLNRFAFFGQLNIYKGPLVLLKAACILQERGITNFTIQIHGANLEHQPEEFQDEFMSFYDKVKNRVQLLGSYRQIDLESKMMEADWMIIPSIWWENSPVVIQESFFYQRPVIGSDIGGTAEKIVGRGGITFMARNESSLASTMERCIGNTALHQGLVNQIENPTTSEICKNLHISLYETLL